MSPRTATLPPTEQAMWRRALARCHPDAGGDAETFIWLSNVREVVCQGREEETAKKSTTTPPPPPRADAHHDTDQERHKESIPFDKGVPFDVLTRRALKLADGLVEPLYADLLVLLEDCMPVYDGGPLEKQQRRGATYKQLAAIGHAVGMRMAQRMRWYEIAREVPLSRRHAGHILSRLKKAARGSAA